MSEILKSMLSLIIQNTIEKLVLIAWFYNLDVSFLGEGVGDNINRIF